VWIDEPQSSVIHDCFVGLFLNHILWPRL